MLKKLLEVAKPIFSKEIKSDGGKINLIFGVLLIILDIALSINFEVNDIFFWGVRDFPTVGVTIVILIYIFLCVGYVCLRDFKK